MIPTGGSIIPPVVAVAFLLLLLIGTAIGVRRRGRPRIVEDGPDDEPYRVFTRDFDLELPAALVADSIEGASHDLEKGWLAQNPNLWHAWAGTAAKLLRDHDAASNWALAIESAASPFAADELAVAILIDQSGSMRGEPIASAAAAAAFVTEPLAKIGTRTEVLGFSTAGWQGGRAYTKWQRDGRPERPGRLSALMHVIYKSADEPALSDAARDLIVNPDLLRENIDGEAILWARQRLAEQPVPHRLLLVISDGAPVDDATLMHNGANYLWRHLLAVLSDARGDPTLTIGAVGIGYDVSSLYPLSETVYAPIDVPPATSRVLVQMLGAAKEKAGFPRSPE